MIKVEEVLDDLKKGQGYVLTSDYDIEWLSGNFSKTLNDYNSYVETVSVPGKTIQTSDSRTANSLLAKIATDVAFEDLEITWRIPADFKIFYVIDDWMNEAIDISNGRIITGYFDDYCKNYKCKIKKGLQAKGQSSITSAIATIDGLYPINRQAIAFSTEGNDYVKFTVTFACYNILVE